MIDKNDWRLTGQENYLKGKDLIFSKYKPRSEKWDHDHCEFCFETISEYPSDINEAYCTADKYHWICEECFADFQEMFGWVVAKKDS